jgi:DNA repair protein RadC
VKANAFSSYSSPIEFKITALRECPVAHESLTCDRPEHAASYWRAHIETAPMFNPECECLVVLILNARLRIKGHQMVTIGTMNMVVAHAREIFRGAIVTSAFGIVLMHNHPSGDPTPSSGDLSVTRDIIRAGRLLKIELLDHVIVAGNEHRSLRDLGYFYQ